jgi:PST family polysaccharide transporter
LKDNYSYARILKSTSIFGMVKLVAMVVGLVRSKFLAVLIGPTGYGILGLFQSTLDLIQLGTGLGIETSGVRNISKTEIQADAIQLQKQVNILVSLSVFLGVAGILITIILSKPLSQFTFGGQSYMTGFIWLSFSLIFRRLTLIQSTVFQGLSSISLLAKANLWSNLLGFLITLPLFFIFEIDAIVPSMLLSSIIAFFVSTYYYQKLKIPFKFYTIIQTFQESKEVLKFGVLLSFSSFFALVSNFLIQIFIGWEGVGICSYLLINF